MSLSRDLLDLLAALDRAQLTVAFLIEYLQDLIRDDPPFSTESERVETEEINARLRALMAELVRRRREPTTQPRSRAWDELQGALPEDLVEEHFVLEGLQNVGGLASRWRKLQTLSLARPPGDKVSGPLREAVNCYLYGLPNASIVLCRAVLEFALTEKLASRIGRMPDRSDLQDLIDFAANSKTLSGSRATLAHRIRARGNEAIHRGAYGDPDALLQIRDAVAVLEEIYGTPRT
jgi:hypothetical protein